MSVFNFLKIEFEVQKEKIDYCFEAAVTMLINFSEAGEIIKHLSSCRYKSCCIACELKNVYKSITENGKANLINLKKKILDEFKDIPDRIDQWQPNLIIDIVNALLNALHYHLTDYENIVNLEYKGKIFCNCTIHNLFGLDIDERYACSCKNTFTEKWETSNYCQFFNMADILLDDQINFSKSARLLKTPMFLFNSLKDKFNSVIQGCMKTKLKALLSSARINYCKKRSCKYKDSEISFCMKNNPKYYFISIIWDNNDVRHMDCYLSTIAISQFINLNDLYNKASEYNYNLKGILFCRKNKYSYAIRSGNNWSFTGLGEDCEWLELIVEITSMKYFPIALIYERDPINLKTEISLSRLLEIEKLACESDYYEFENPGKIEKLLVDCTELFNNRKKKMPEHEPFSSQKQLGLEVNEEISKAKSSGKYEDLINTRDDEIKIHTEVQNKKDCESLDSRFNHEINTNFLDQKNEVKANEIASSENSRRKKVINDAWKCICETQNKVSEEVCLFCYSLKPGVLGWVCKICKKKNNSAQKNCYFCVNNIINPSPDKSESTWKCTSCSEDNISKNNRCFKCKASRNFEEVKSRASIPIKNNEQQLCKECHRTSDSSEEYCLNCKVKKLLSENRSDVCAFNWKCQVCVHNNLYSIENCSKCCNPKGTISIEWECLCCLTKNSSFHQICQECKKLKGSRPICKCGKILSHLTSSCIECDNQAKRQQSSEFVCPKCGNNLRYSTEKCNKCKIVAISANKKNITIIDASSKRSYEKQKCKICSKEISLIACGPCKRTVIAGEFCKYCNEKLESTLKCIDCIENEKKYRKCISCGKNTLKSSAKCLYCKNMHK